MPNAFSGAVAVATSLSTPSGQLSPLSYAPLLLPKTDPQFQA